MHLTALDGFTYLYYLTPIRIRKDSAEAQIGETQEEAPVFVWW